MTEGMSEKAVFEVRPFVQNYAWGMRDGTGDVARLHKATGLKFLNFLRKTREKRHNITILMRFERKFRFGRPNSSLLRSIFFSFSKKFWCTGGHVDVSKPYAELWMGCHKSGMNMVQEKMLKRALRARFWTKIDE